MKVYDFLIDKLSKLFEPEVKALNDEIIHGDGHSCPKGFLNTPTDYEAFYDLVNIIMDKGESFPKKHGKWVMWRFIGDGHFLQLDTYNNAMTLKRGDATYNEWNGFSGESVCYFGIDFGGFKPRNMDKLRMLLNSSALRANITVRFNSV